MKFLATQFQRCDLGEEVYFNDDTSFDQCTRIKNPGSSTTRNLAKVIINHFNNANNWKNVYDNLNPGSTGGNLKNCQLGSICIGGYVSDRILIVVNFNDVTEDYMSTEILMNY